MSEKFSLLFTPSGATMEQIVGDKTIVGYLANDEGYVDDSERSWAIYTARSSSPTSDLNKFREALGLDESYQKDRSLIPNRWAVQLDVYVHGNSLYSISGEGPQCQFDTAKGAAVWVPDESLIEYFESMNNGYGATLPELHQHCRNCLLEFNSIMNGEVFGICVEMFNKNGERISEESCWGFVGREDAEKLLASDYMEPMINSQKEGQNVNL